MSCPNYTSAAEVQLLNPYEKLVVVTLYSVLALVAICGNAGVIFVVIRFPKMRASSTNLFIINLAIADITMAVVCIPFSYWPILILQFWPFGKFMCKVISFSKVASILLSAHTLSVISIDRLIAVSFPLRRPLSQLSVCVVLALVWLVDLATALPVLLVSSTVKVPSGPNNSLQEQCTERWADWHIARGSFIYSSTLMILQYFLPLGIMSVSYLLIGWKLWLAKQPGESDRRTAKDRRGTTKKIIYMMLCVSFMYALCYLPQNAFNISWTLCETVLENPLILYIWWGCHFSAMVQCSLNPIIYVIFSGRYREGFSYIFRRCPCVNYRPIDLGLTPLHTLRSTSAYSRTANTNCHKNSGKIPVGKSVSCGYQSSAAVVRCQDPNEPKPVTPLLGNPRHNLNQSLSTGDA